MEVLFAVTVLLINIVLWVIFFLKYKKRFSSEKYISDIRRELNNLTADINRTTERNIQLIQATVTRSKALSHEIDLKLEQLDRKLALINTDMDIHQKSTHFLGQTGPSFHNEKDKGIPAGTVNFSELKERLHRAADEVPEGFPPAPAPRDFDFSSHFDRQADELNLLNIKDEVIITSEGAAYREVPVISTNTYPDPVNTYQWPKKKEKDVGTQVMEMYTGGKTVSEIAAILSISVTEVQFIIDMG